MIDVALELLGAAISGDGAASGLLIRVGRDPRAMPEVQAAGDVPVLIYPATGGAAAAATAAGAFTTLTGISLELSASAPCRGYRFGNASTLWPFGGLALDEDCERILHGVVPAPGVEALVSTESGGVFVRGHAGRRSVYLSLVPLPDPDQVRLLKDEFRAGRFMGLLALLVFAREALGDAGWRTPRVGASFLVDDPNLRLPRYGFLELDRVLDVARREDFHLAVAMIPLDYAKTRERAARLVRSNPDRLSLVMHGVDHRRLEFETDVPKDRAEAALAQALARMQLHEGRTGIAHARVMTFPHGGCNSTWMRALASTGFDAALASRALPFAHETGLGNPLYEMHPAELSFEGFPMVNRFKAEEPVERLLFQAWLGKPLIVYTHHQFFRGGLEGVAAIARFLNEQVRPRWTDIGSMVAANYQVRTTAAGPAVRVFANRVTLALDGGTLAVLKPSPAAGQERAELDGEELALTRTVDGLAACERAPRTGLAEIVFRPARVTSAQPLTSVSFLSRMRRVATEIRDQGAPLTALVKRYGSTR